MGKLLELTFMALRYSGIPFLIREVLQRRKVTIILFHDIAPELFERHIGTLKKRYHIIALQDYLKARQDRSRVLPPKALIITFDDGLKRNYDLLPILKRHKIPITIFLCSAIVDTQRHYWFMGEMPGEDIQALKKLPHDARNEILKNQGFAEEREFDSREALTSQEMAKMAAWVDFQSHTRFHPILPNCLAARAEDEIRGSKQELEERFGFQVNVLSYPNGDYSERDVLLTQAAGYEAGITLDLGYNTLTTDPFRLKRFCMSDTGDTAELLVKTSGVWQFLKRLVVKPDSGLRMSID